jgi:predicted RNase H-like nuclease (RuvC/YqgF family)
MFQLQKDIVDQDILNKDQEAKIDHLEKVIEDLVDRISKMEDKANMEENTNQRETRSKAAPPQKQPIDTKIQAMEKQHKDMEEHLQEVEGIVEQLNDTSTQP